MGSEMCIRDSHQADIWSTSQETWLNSRDSKSMKKTSCTDQTEAEYYNMDDDTHRSRFIKTLVSRKILAKEVLESKPSKTGRQINNSSFHL